MICGTLVMAVVSDLIAALLAEMLFGLLFA